MDSPNHGRQAFLPRLLADFPPIMPGSETFSSAVRSGRRKYPWNMKPIFRFRNRACEGRRTVVKISSLEFDRPRFRTLQTGERGKEASSYLHPKAPEERRFVCVRPSSRYHATPRSGEPPCGMTGKDRTPLVAECSFHLGRFVHYFAANTMLTQERLASYVRQ